MIKVAMVGGVLAIGLVAALGLYLFLKGARNVQLSVASRSWPTAAGVVVGSETSREVLKGNRRTNTSSSVMFETRTSVKFYVDSREYTTDVLYFGKSLGSGDKSEAALQRLRFPAGRPVTVSYKPGNPAIATVRPGLHADAFWLLGAGLAFLLPAVLVFFVGSTLFREMSTDDNDQSAFATQVEQAMQAAKRGDRSFKMPEPPGSAADNKIAGVVAVGFGAVMCGLGILALSAGMARIWHGSASQNWPKANGTVIFAQKGGGEDGKDADDDTTDPVYKARIVYQYDVAGVTHFNNVRQFAQVEGGSQDELDRIAQQYRKGAPVKVAYYPTDPDISVLEPGNTGSALIIPGLGVFLLLFSLAVFHWIVPAVSK